MKVSIARKAYFSCAHRYYLDDWSMDKNISEFGVCATPHGHGHDYVLEATFSGPVDSQTGMILNLRIIDEILKSVTTTLDQRHLNFDIEEFKTHVPTTENLGLFLFRKIRTELARHPLPQVEFTALRLYECDELWVDITVESKC